METKRMTLKGKIVLENNGQLTINLIGDEHESIHFNEGGEVEITSDFQYNDDF